MTATVPFHEPLVSRTADTRRPGARRRIVGLDVARALAVFGMFAAHIGLSEDLAWKLSWSPSTWGAVVHGRSAALFAVLAGLSIGLLSGGREPWAGDDLVRARVQIMVRAAWLFLIGGVLELLGSDVNVILSYYAVIFVLMLPFLRWGPRRVLLLAAGLMVTAPPIAVLIGQITMASELETPFATLLVTGDYPALTWWTFFLVGLAISRLDLRAGRVRAALLVTGAATAVVGYALAWLSTRLLSAAVPSAGLEEGFERPGTWNWAWLSGAQSHSGTPLWLVASAGVAVAVIAICLVFADALPRASYPLACVGGMALTAYSLQIVALSVFGTESPSGLFLLSFSVLVVVLCVAWRAVAGRGPLERLLTWSSNAAAGRAAGSARMSGAHRR